MAIKACNQCGGVGRVNGDATCVTKCFPCEGKGYICTLCGATHENWSKAVSNLGPLPCACEVDPKRQKSIHVDRQHNAPQWTPLVEVQHEVTVTIPGWLLRIPESDRQEFADWLYWLAGEVRKDPEKEAYSIG